MTFSKNTHSQQNSGNLPLRSVTRPIELSAIFNVAKNVDGSISFVLFSEQNRSTARFLFMSHVYEMHLTRSRTKQSKLTQANKWARRHGIRIDLTLREKRSADSAVFEYLQSTRPRSSHFGFRLPHSTAEHHKMLCALFTHSCSCSFAPFSLTPFLCRAEAKHFPN